MRILFADDHRLMSEGLKALIADDPNYEVIGTVQDGLQAIEHADRYRPDILIMDISMPGMNGIEATRVIRGQHNLPTRVVMVSMHTDPEFVAEAFRAGAQGYLVKGVGGDEFKQALTAISKGDTYLSPQVAGSVMEQFVTNPNSHQVPPRYTLLTPRERQTLQLLAEGQTVKGIAAELKLSDKTVHAFRTRLMEKLELDSIAALTKYAIRHGLTTLE